MNNSGTFLENRKSENKFLNQTWSINLVKSRCIQQTWDSYNWKVINYITISITLFEFNYNHLQLQYTPLNWDTFVSGLLSQLSGVPN